MKCSGPNCSYMICATCRIDDEKEEKLKEKLLEHHPVLLKVCGSIVNRKREGEKTIPEYGVCIPICSKKIKVQKFKKIEVKNIWTIFGLEVKKGEEKVFQMNELIKKTADLKFLKKYLVFEIPEEKGKELIKIDINRAKKECIIPAKVK